MYYGFDVGGTKIEFGAFNEQLERVATERVPTPTCLLYTSDAADD